MRGVILLLFDLPLESKAQRREYGRFRRELMSEGYRPVQKSVYAKLLRNTRSASPEMQRLRAISPAEGTIQAIPMTLAHFKLLTPIRGGGFGFAIFSDDILCIAE